MNIFGYKTHPLCRTDFNWTDKFSLKIGCTWYPKNRVAFYEFFKQVHEFVGVLVTIHGCFNLYYRRSNDGDVQRRHSRQTSGRQRPVSTGALATNTAAAANTSQSSSPSINTRSNVSASTPSVPHPAPPHGQPPPQGEVTHSMISMITVQTILCQWTKLYFSWNPNIENFQH